MRRNVGLILLLAASMAIGIVIGIAFFNLFLHTIPPAVLSGFNRGAAKAAFMTYGVIAGVVIAIWSLGVALLWRLFTRQAAQSGPKG